MMTTTCFCFFTINVVLNRYLNDFSFESKNIITLVLYLFKLCFEAVVVTQLVKWSLPTMEVHSLNLIIGKIYN